MHGLVAHVPLGTEENGRDGFPCLPLESPAEGQLETSHCMFMVSVLDSDLKGPFFCLSLYVSVHVCTGMCMCINAQGDRRSVSGALYCSPSFLSSQALSLNSGLTEWVH